MEMGNIDSLFKRKACLSAITSLLLCGQTQAIEFQFGDVEAVFNSEISLGKSWRVEAADPSLLKDVYGNYGNNDDANNNYKKGDSFSEIIKGVHDLELRYENFGLFVRGKYWYDRQMDKGNVHYGNLAQLDSNGIPGAALIYNHPNEPLNDDNFDSLSKASGVALLDAYIYGEFEVGDTPVDLRLGKQVINWGEGNFIRSPLNSISPIDSSALRRPGATVKEALLPINMAFASFGMTENLTSEFFYQLGYQETVVDGCGTYFSGTDYVTSGCDSISLSNGATSIARNTEGVRKSTDSGQLGVAMRYYSEALADTEFGLYFMKINDRLPIVSFTKHDVGGSEMGALFQQTIQIWQQVGQGSGYDSVAGLYTALVSKDRISTSSYVTDYTSQIQVTGFTFATNVGGLSLSGEYSLLKDKAIQINGPMVVSALLTENSTSTELKERVKTTGNGDFFSGSDDFDVSQLQLTAINTFDQVLGASQVSILGEIGYTYVHDFNDSPTATKYGRSGIFGLYDHNPNNPAAINDGFVTQASWGYRTLVSAQYNNVIAGVNFKPSILWSHDVNGYAPQPGGNFIEGNKKIAVNLSASYLETYSALIAYTHYSGGDFSVLKDHDFMSVNFGVIF